MSTALALRPLSAPILPFGLRASPALLDAAIGALDHGHGTDRALDAAIYEALGWQVERGAARRRLGWRCRSPLSTAWEALPSPTGCVEAAARLRPWGWAWGVAEGDGPARGWVRELRPRPGREARFNECNRLTPARALLAAALFGHRSVILRS